MFATTAIGQRDRPALPPGRSIELPGRGTTFVREVPGPADAPVVFLLHGWSATADLNWHPYYRPLARHFRVIAIDHRSHGRGIRHDEPFRLEDCADDVAAVADHLGVERFIVVGYSMGGPIAQLVWRDHRDLVDGLVLCATSSGFRSSARMRMLFRAASGVSAVGVGSTLSTVAGSAFSAIERLGGKRDNQSWAVAQLARHDWGQLVEAGHQIGRYEATDWVASVTVPTSVVVTLEDEVVPTRHQVALARSIPGATLRRVAGGHHGCVTDPDAFEPVLVDACREVAARAAYSVESLDADVA